MADTRDSAQAICPSAALVEGAVGVRFSLRRAGRPVPAFAVRYGGTVHAYINRCAHRGVELDWEPGRFFDSTGCLLICATHGAVYDPITGVCVAGPCTGAALCAVPVREDGGHVWLASEGGLELA